MEIQVLSQGGRIELGFPGGVAAWLAKAAGALRCLSSIRGLESRGRALPSSDVSWLAGSRERCPRKQSTAKVSRCLHRAVRLTLPLLRAKMPAGPALSPLSLRPGSAQRRAGFSLDLHTANEAISEPRFLELEEG